MYVRNFAILFACVGLTVAGIVPIKGPSKAGAAPPSKVTPAPKRGPILTHVRTREKLIDRYPFIITETYTVTETQGPSISETESEPVSMTNEGVGFTEEASTTANATVISLEATAMESSESGAAPTLNPAPIVTNGPVPPAKKN
ncbi:hypothetical protein HGRIS_014573 [Hohenbuehelia grisea]|uniref:Uncharacterized protein n=1 Tax=Hohenbuehelia grisea TaxID=104357 RepID=A0ABR3JTY3_9AGAR